MYELQIFSKMNLQTASITDIYNNSQYLSTAKLHKINKKISYFTEKYKCSFTEFEKRIKKLPDESFEMWDDYIEWQGFENIKSELFRNQSFQ